MVTEEDGGGGKVREQRPDYAIPGSEGNLSSKYCGISYEEARWFCHLSANKSFPLLDPRRRGSVHQAPDYCRGDVACHGGANVRASDVRPLILPSISIPPTPGPTTESPMTKVSDYPGGHNFCGFGFDNLFN
jgi:hypothetical protein